MKLFGLFGKSDDKRKEEKLDQAPPEVKDDSADRTVSEAEAVRGATMTDVIKAVTDQFALINAENTADLRAVGAALCQIPEEMASLSPGFTSFRHEVLHAILLAGDADTISERYGVLERCLSAVQLDAGFSQHSRALQFIAAELFADLISPETPEAQPQAGLQSEVLEVPPAPSDASAEAPEVDHEPANEVARQSGSISDNPLSETEDAPKNESEQAAERLPEVELSVVPDAGGVSQDIAEPEDRGFVPDEAPASVQIDIPAQLIGSVEHADQLIAVVNQARQGVQGEQLDNFTEHYAGAPENLTSLIEALKGVTTSCLDTLDNSFNNELETLAYYKDICQELELGDKRLSESRRCMRFIDANLNGDGSDDDLSGTENQWLVSLATQLRNISKEQSAIAVEKGEQIRSQIDEIQLEADQASELIKQLGAQTLEPPATVLRSLTGADFSEEESDEELDYEESIDQYIEWMKSQREEIRKQRARIEELDQRMADAERSADRQYAGRLEPLQKRKSELRRNLEDALLSAGKDADETETRLNALRQDAETLLSDVDKAVAQRRAYASAVEETMGSMMIRLGRVLDEANLSSAVSTSDQEG
ncbi:MAG: hypothetical protein O2981_01675 [Proteobacteria bacterium]|nr:hypothetical protein [Pseudomonadota bacterium]